MAFDEFQKKLEQLDCHIHAQSTGSSHQFSEKLNISRSTFFKYCDYLKELGA
jgi:ACT domain-containing protein